MTIDDEAIERLVAAAQTGRPRSVRGAVRPLPRAGLPLRRRPRRPPERRGGPGAARLRQGPGGAAALRVAGRPLRGLALPAGQERRDRPRPDAPRARHARPRSPSRPTDDDGPDELAVLRQEMDSVAHGAAAADAGAARGHRAAVLRGPVREGGGRGHGPAGRAPFGASSSGPSRRCGGSWGSRPATCPSCRGTRDERNDPMNEDDDGRQSSRCAGEELERTLARYARVRLDPSPAQAGAPARSSWRRPGARDDPERRRAG